MTREEMTVEEAIQVLQSDINWSKLNEYPYIGQRKVKALNMAIKALEQEPCDDCINRQAVEKIINKWLSHPDYELKDSIYDMTKKIHNLPSVTPQPKTGRWILKRTFLTKLSDEYIREYECSECGRAIRCTESQLINYPYSHCGAKMEEVEE